MIPETDAALSDLYTKFRQFARDRVLRGSTGSNPAAVAEPNPDTDQSEPSATELPADDDQPSNSDFSQ